MLPRIGFIGVDFRKGGDILLGINLGGGGDAYRRTAADSLLLPMIAALRTEEASLEAAKTAFGQYAVNMLGIGREKTESSLPCSCGDAQFGDLAPCDHRLGTKRSIGR